MTAETEEESSHFGGLPRWVTPMHGESARAFRAWTYYRDLPPEIRSLDRAWRASRGDQESIKSRRAPGRWRFWSVRYAWTVRARAYDAVLAQRAVSAEMLAMDGEGARGAARRQLAEESVVTTALALQDRLGDLLARPLADQGEDLSLRDLERAINLFGRFVEVVGPLVGVGELGGGVNSSSRSRGR